MSFIRKQNTIPPLPSPPLVVVAPVIAKLDLVRRKQRLLWSNKTLQTKVSVENAIDVARGDILESSDLGLDFLGCDKWILLDQPLHFELGLIHDLLVLGPTARILLTRGGTRNRTWNIRPSSSSLGSSHPVIERVLGDVQLLTDVLGLHLGLLHLEGSNLDGV